MGLSQDSGITLGNPCKGRIIWSGTSAEIDRSGNPFVDQFIHGRAEGPIQMQVRKL